jgi:hypothetical protein
MTISLGDRLNPILVKETRQSLKSRQFVITFTLLLAVSWGWSMFGLGLMGAQASYGVRGGQFLFNGYCAILGFALLIIVPFGALRSLANEQEDRTFEVLAITTLRPRQIVTGKLGSAVLQMLVYLSAVAPCLAFTYLLRGVDFLSIVMALGYLFLSSLGLSLLGLLVAAQTGERHRQAVHSVLVVIGLLMFFGLSCSLLAGLEIASASFFGDPVFWTIVAAVLSFYASGCVLALLAAAARLTFASENRSSRLRAAMLVQHLLCVGWMSWFWIRNPPAYEPLVVFVSLVGLQWFAIGALAVGESPQLSPRARRGLPVSFLGRMFLTWFNPGPGTGYVFVLCGTLSGLLWTALVTHFDPRWAAAVPRPSGVSPATLAAYSVLGLSYMTIFLGVGLLLLRAVRRFAPTSLALSVLLQTVLMLAACAVPVVIQWSSPQWSQRGYTLMQITNVVWSMEEVLTAPGSAYEPILLTYVPLAAVVVLALNLPGVLREVRSVRAAKPWRVAEEDAQQTALRHPAVPVPISPWDVE